jgi:hypothetical protein
MPKKSESASSKEAAIANKLLQESFGCKEQSCGKIGACAILCEDLKCSTLNSVRANRALESLGGALPITEGWCPTQIICSKVSCGKVDCSNMKTK